MRGLAMIDEETNKEFATYLEYRLQEWAEWFSKGNFYGVGFPSCTVEYRLMTEALINQQSGYKSLHCNSDAEEIELLINEMAEQNFKMALALRTQYFKKRKAQDYSSEVGVSGTRFRGFVEMGKQWLAGRLSASIKVRR
jgi:hypothetical protein